MRFSVRGALCAGRSINAGALAASFGLDVDVVHEFCGKARTTNGRYYQRLRNTPGIDYTPVGQYPGRVRFPRGDGRTNPLKQHSALLPKQKGMNDDNSRSNPQSV